MSYSANILFIAILVFFAVNDVQDVKASNHFSFVLKEIEEEEDYKIPNFLKFVRGKLEEFAETSKMFGVFDETVEFYRTLYNLIFRRLSVVLRYMITTEEVKLADAFDEEYRKVFMRLKDLSIVVTALLKEHKDQKELHILYPFFLGIQILVDSIPLATDNFLLPVD